MSTSGGLLANYTYAADAAGNITQINDLTDSGYNRTFGYDDLNRLVTANSGASLWGTGGCTYDSMGNMLTSTLGPKMRSFTYAGTAPLINAVSADGALTSMQYDAAGNELNGPAGFSTTFVSDTRAYSARNLLQQVDLTSPAHQCFGRISGETCTRGWVLQRTSTLWNGYDARGVRVVSMQSDSVPSLPDMKFYFYTPELTQLATFAPNDGIGSDVIWFGGRPVASDTIGDPAPRFTFTDHLGTPILQTDAVANVVWRAEYEPFGNFFAMRTGSASEQLLRFPGQQVAFTNFAGDEENYNIFRWYRSGWGRYTQADPLLNLAFSRSLRRFVEDAPSPDFAQPSWYAFVDGNPLSYIDQLGLKLTNNTKCVIYVKPENSDVPVLVPPGQAYPGDQDGYASPCTNPDHVFKSVDNVDVNVSPKGPETDANGFISRIGQMIKGGWKDEDWKKKLDKKGDKGWDKLFEKSRKGKCLCCAQ